MCVCSLYNMRETYFHHDSHYKSCGSSSLGFSPTRKCYAFDELIYRIIMELNTSSLFVVDFKEKRTNFMSYQSSQKIRKFIEITFLILAKTWFTQI